MILHIEFSDGSNPYVSFPRDRHELKKQWGKWERNYKSKAQIKAHNGDYMAEIAGDFSGYWVWERGNFFATKRKYKHLGHAVQALERLGNGG